MAAGMSSSAVDRAIRSGRLQRLFPGTYARAAGALPQATWDQAAVLFAGPGAALSHQSAARVQGWRADDGSRIHVTIPEARRIDPQPRLVVHRARQWDDTHALFNLTPARTRVERTIIDLLRGTSSEAQIVALVTDLARARLTTPDKVLEALSLAPRIPRRRLTLALLTEAMSGVHSVLEHHFLHVVRRHGLPQPRLQARVELPDGTVYYLDTLFDPYGVVVELDGLEWHGSADAQDRDRRRDNAHALLGRTPLRYGWTAITSECCDVASEIGSLLIAAGWTGKVHRCGRSAPENRGQRSA